MNISGSFIHEISAFLIHCFKSIRFSFTAFVTTLILNGLIIHLYKIFNVSKFICFILIISNSLICIFSFITFILLGGHWLCNKLYDLYVYLFGTHTYRELIKESIKMALTNRYIRSDLYKLYINNPSPTSLLADNVAKYLVDRLMIRESNDLTLIPNNNMDRIYFLTKLGLIVCRKIFPAIHS